MIIISVRLIFHTRWGMCSCLENQIRTGLPDAPFFTPGKMLSEMASHSIDWWFTGEDLPDPDNRVTVLNGQIHLEYKENNTDGFRRLIHVWKKILGELDTGHALFRMRFI